MDGTGPISKGSARASVKHGQDLGHDRRGHLLRPVGPDVEPCGSMQRGEIRLVRRGRELGEKPVRPVAWSEHAEVGHAAAEESAEEGRIAVEVVAHDGDRRPLPRAGGIGGVRGLRIQQPCAGEPLLAEE